MSSSTRTLGEVSLKVSILSYFTWALVAPTYTTPDTCFITVISAFELTTQTAPTPASPALHSQVSSADCSNDEKH